MLAPAVHHVPFGAHLRHVAALAAHVLEELLPSRRIPFCRRRPRRRFLRLLEEIGRDTRDHRVREPVPGLALEVLEVEEAGHLRVVAKGPRIDEPALRPLGRRLRGHAGEVRPDAGQVLEALHLVAAPAAELFDELAPLVELHGLGVPRVGLVATKAAGLHGLHRVHGQVVVLVDLPLVLLHPAARLRPVHGFPHDVVVGRKALFVAPFVHLRGKLLVTAVVVRHVAGSREVGRAVAPAMARRATERRVRMRRVRVDEEVEARVRPQNGLGILLLVLETAGLGRDVARDAPVDALAPEEVDVVEEPVELHLLDFEGRGEHVRDGRVAHEIERVVLAERPELRLEAVVVGVQLRERFLGVPLRLLERRQLRFRGVPSRARRLFRDRGRLVSGSQPFVFFSCRGRGRRLRPFLLQGLEVVPGRVHLGLLETEVLIGLVPGALGLPGLVLGRGDRRAVAAQLARAFAFLFEKLLLGLGVDLLGGRPEGRARPLAVVLDEFLLPALPVAPVVLPRHPRERRQHEDRHDREDLRQPPDVVVVIDRFGRRSFGHVRC